ncbi:MAG: GNAT family N-acetyltransferase [Pseudomonadota bacterium]
MDTDVFVLQSDQVDLLNQVADDVFDNVVQPELVAEFIADSRHHLAVAVSGNAVVGFASAVHYVHPDKPNELWVNEIGVTPVMQGQGIGKRLMKTLLALGAELGCDEAWVLADEDNARARSFYESLDGEASAAVMYSFRCHE